MIEKKIKLPPRSDYPAEPWRFVQKKLDEELLGRDESIFTVSNGYLGIRGSFEEDEPIHQRGTFISGFHETWPITYGEEAYGFAKTGQTMVSAPSAHMIKLYVDDEPFSLRHAHLMEYERALDFKKGLLSRSLIWDTAAGKQVKIESERLVSFPERHLAAVFYKVTLLNDDAFLGITSELVCEQPNSHNDGDPRKAPKMPHRVYIPEIQRTNDKRITLGYSLANSKMQLVCGMDHQLFTSDRNTVRVQRGDYKARVTYTIDAHEGQSVTLVKFISYHTSSPYPDLDELGDRVERTLDRAMDKGYESVKNSQITYLEDFWKHADIKLTTEDPSANPYLRLQIYHLIQASARVQNSGIAAKGLTGNAYEGHSFWDMEIYMMPFLIYNNPRVAMNLLIYRHTMLPKARNRARELNQKGALFPWRTINGDEASAFFAAGTAQYHINADIAYAVKKYSEITNDWAFLCEYGAEILVETARLWADLGFFDEGKFNIHGVTGPDEYTAIVNNNTFTNLMARENMHYAAKVVKEMAERFPDEYKALQKATNLEEHELDEWNKAADCMLIPFSEKLGINPQDDTFLQKEKWDLKNTPPDKFPLLLHYHPLVLYRFQVIKQADVVLAMFLLGDEFSQELKKRNFDYYDPLTTGDSSLSVSIQGIVAAEMDYVELAQKYITYALLMDIADIGDNADHGLHLASMGGVWMSVIYGIAGLRDHDGNITFNPKLSGQLQCLNFHLTVRGNLLDVEVGLEQTTYHLKEGEGLTFHHCGQEISLTKGESASVKHGETVDQ